MKKLVNVTLKVDLELITDTFGSGACAYWAEVRAKGRWYEVREHNAEDRDPTAGPWVYVGPEKMVEGFQLMATEFPHLFGRILEGNGDSEAGDVLTQLCVLGEVKYG